MKKKCKHILIAIMMTSLTIGAQEPAGIDSGFHKHDGFYLNMIAGGGTSGFSLSSGSTKLDLSGVAYSFGIKLGGAITENIVIFGAIDGSAMSNPSGTQTVNGVTTSGTAASSILSMNNIGGGIGFYTDSNFFMTASAGIASGTFTQLGLSASSETGFGGNLNIGKEWWVSANWALGAAVVGNYSAVKYPGGPSSQYYVGLAFSATYN